ncbi:MAG: acetyl-CoA carboxylase biotin carboxylase subunit [Acidobacteriia bacterium]|jgi:acetyl-CoA carboxylase biotin carboxylase subunit|nr:acetyl-CoA carboxylase biotin carboxylase subunit [Terriglobia bacterium]
MFRKILIANRGEIAVRVIRACHEMGIAAVAVFSEVDRAALHVRLADEAYPIGPAPSRESYLRIDRLMEVARRAGCDALHPGYGFLAENPALPRACREAGVVFIGPSAEAMERLGSKTAARQLARAADVPTVPGTLEPIESFERAQQIAQQIGYPVLLKAVAGGGGKGMRLVMGPAELAAAWRDASSEALNAFGDGRLYLEKYLAEPRHIEVQVLADQHGNVVYLGERECSIQRRHQKVVEEAPSPIMDPALRQQMGEAAVRLARAAGYTNAGTCEFLVDADRRFYFLEVNTRLQVEHPVTEAVTGLDLVKLQIRVAAGERLPLQQDDVVLRGHAIECRIYAEDPENQFFPSPGKILAQRLPAGPGIRTDDGVYAGAVIPNEYDPLIGKLIAFGRDRTEAIARLRRALDEYYVSGVRTNIPMFRRLLADPAFARAEFHTRWLDGWLERVLRDPARFATRDGTREAEDAAALAAALWHVAQNGVPASAQTATAPAASPWKLEGRRELLRRDPRD